MYQEFVLMGMMPSATTTLPQSVNITNIARTFFAPEDSMWSRVSLKKILNLNSRIPSAGENRQQQGRAAYVIWPLKHSDPSNRCRISGNTWVLAVSPGGSVRREKKERRCQLLCWCCHVISIKSANINGSDPVTTDQSLCPAQRE